MHSLKLQIVTPQRIVLEKEVFSVTAPTATGEITILPHHINLFTLLKEGLVKIKFNKEEEYYAIGGGYLQTDGEKVIVLVSRAYGQNEINEKIIEESRKKAQELLKTAQTEKEKQEAISLLRRSTIDDKLLRKVKKRRL